MQMKACVMLISGAIVQVQGSKHWNAVQRALTFEGCTTAGTNFFFSISDEISATVLLSME